MKNIYLIFLLLLYPIFAFSQGMKSAKEAVLLAESNIIKSILENDTAKLASQMYMVGDFELNRDGISRREFLLDMKKFWHPKEQKHTQQRVRILNNFAIVTGVADFKWQDSAAHYEAREKYMDVYILVKGTWLQAANQGSEEIQNDKKTLETEAQKTVETLWKAWETGNKALAEPIYDKEFIDTDFNGIKRNKQEVLSFLKPPPADQVAKITLSDWHFIVKNNTVIVNYIGEDRRERNGTSTTLKFRATDTYIKKYGHWRIVSGQQVLTKN